MNPHQVYGKMIIASGEDSGAFVYEPSFAQTSRSFNARMDKRIADAKKDQEAVESGTRMQIAEGSVNPCVELPIPYTHYGD